MVKPLKKRSTKYDPLPVKQTSKKKVLMLIGLILGILYAFDPALFPPQVRNHQITRTFYKYRDQIALQLPEIIRPASVVAAPKTNTAISPGQGYAPTERRKMEDLMNKGTAK